MQTRSAQTTVGFVTRLTLLSALAATLYLAGNNRVGLFDRDEPWYAEISREMARTGDWVVPRFMGAPFIGKPVLSFWCNAASILAFGETTFAVRLPSAVASLVTIWLLAIFLAKFIGRRRAIWSALIFSTSVLTIILSKMCLTDAILLPCITLAQLMLYAIYRNRGGFAAIALLWLAIGLAILAKGPVVLGIQAATVLALLVLDVGGQWRCPTAWRDAARWWPRTKPWLGILIAAAVVLPWAIKIQRSQPGFLQRTWVHNMFGPIVKASLEGHGAPPGYYLLLIWPLFFPWSLFLPLAICKGWVNRHLTPIRFAFAAVIGPWVLIELVKQKLPHYWFPMFPPLAFLTADVIVRSVRGQAHYFRPQLRGGVAGWATVAGIAGFIPFIAIHWSVGSSSLPWPSMWILATGMMVYAAAVAILFIRRKLAQAAAGMGVGMALAAIFAYSLILPRLDFMRLSPRSAAALRAHGVAAPGDNVAIIISKSDNGHERGYKEPSLIYYLGGRPQILDAATLESPGKSLPHWLVLTDEIWNSCCPATRDQLQKVATYNGLNYGGGGRMTRIIIAETRQTSPRLEVAKIH